MAYDEASVARGDSRNRFTLGLPSTPPLSNTPFRFTLMRG